ERRRKDRLQRRARRSLRGAIAQQVAQRRLESPGERGLRLDGARVELLARPLDERALRGERRREPEQLDVRCDVLRTAVRECGVTRLGPTAARTRRAAHEVDDLELEVV